MANHIVVCKGLVHYDSIKYLPSVLSKGCSDISTIDEKEIKKINKKALRRPEAFCKSFDYDLHGALFTGDVLIRGGYYDRLAETAGRQVVHHMTRRTVLVSTPAAAVKLPPDTAYYVVAMIGNLARKQKTPQERMAAWAEYVQECRQPMRDSKMLGKPDPRACAVRLMKDLGFVSGFRWADPWVKRFTHVVGAGTYVVVNVYATSRGVPREVAEGVSVAAAKTSATLFDFSLRSGLQRIEQSKWGAGRLAEAGAGRVFSHKEAYRAAHLS